MSNILNRFSTEEEVDLQADKYLTFLIEKRRRRIGKKGGEPYETPHIP